MFWAIFKIPSAFKTVPALQAPPQQLKIPYKVLWFITSFISGLPECDLEQISNYTSPPLEWLPSITHMACKPTVK